MRKKDVIRIIQNYKSPHLSEEVKSDLIKEIEEAVRRNNAKRS